MSDVTWLSPPAIAKQLGIDPNKVLAWIRRGELVAINVAEKTSSRPRWKVSPAALEDFFRRRQCTPPEKVGRRVYPARVSPPETWPQPI
jgi:hypothetical protein